MSFVIAKVKTINDFILKLRCQFPWLFFTSAGYAINSQYVPDFLNSENFLNGFGKNFAGDSKTLRYVYRCSH